MINRTGCETEAKSHQKDPRNESWLRSNRAIKLRNGSGNQVYVHKAYKPAKKYVSKIAFLIGSPVFLDLYQCFHSKCSFAKENLLQINESRARNFSIDFRFSEARPNTNFVATRLANT